MWLFILACLVPSFLISLAGTALMRRLAPRLGLIDQPAARKVHKAPTPLGGGVGIWLGVVVPLALGQLLLWRWNGGSNPPSWVPPEIARTLEGALWRSGQAWAVIAGGTVLAFMGLLDDRRALAWQPRLIGQFTVAIALVLLGIRATVFVPLPWVGSVLTVFWLVLLVNSFNFLDNMDGLSSGIGLIVSVLFATIMLRYTSEPRWLVAGFLLVLAGSLVGFLCHNWHPARIFMGDSGSYFIGLMLACMTVLGTFYHPSLGSRHVMLAPLCVLAVPLYDFCSVMIIRLSEGRSPFHPDKRHFSHRLVDLGLSPRNAVLTVHFATLTTGLGGLLLYETPDWSGALLVAALVLCVLVIIAILENVRRGKRVEIAEWSGRNSEPRIQNPEGQKGGEEE